MATEGHHSILYEPVNAVWHGVARVTGLEDRVGEVPDHVVMSMFVVVLCIAFFVPIGRRLKRDQPGTVQQLAELFVQGVGGMIDDVVGPGAGKRFLPFIGTFAAFIFLCNFCGQLFFLQPPTQNTNTTFALAITAWVAYHLVGLKRHGLGYFKQLSDVEATRQLHQRVSPSSSLLSARRILLPAQTAATGAGTSSLRARAPSSA